MAVDLDTGSDREKNKAFVVIGLLGLLLSALLSPLVFSAFFAMAPLLAPQVYQLGIFSGCLFVASLLLMLLRSRIRPAIGLLFLSVLIPIGLELTARLGIHLFAPQSTARLARLGARTYPHMMAYRGHPFFQFTGNPSSVLIGNQALRGLTPFNNFGFHGRDFQYEKPPGTVRIAALGGSTTAPGYTIRLEEYLNENRPDDSRQYEVMNFAHGWYNSAHVLVNFVLNVVDFSPDYIVIHSGWNERFVRNAAGEFRRDYSHALKNFEPPTIVDRYAIRWSVIYRHVKFSIAPDPFWFFLDSATRIDYRQVTEGRWQSPDELEPYERNLRTILELARLRGIKVVLTTQAHTTDAAARPRDFDQTMHIDQCNEIMRRLHREFEGTYFVDLDRSMTGTMNEVFTDVAHVNREGQAFKAEQIGKLILEDRS